MKKFIKKYKKLFGMLLLILAITFFIFWEFIGRSELLHENIVVLKEDVNKGTLITLDMLTLSKIPAENYINTAINDVNSIVGLEAVHYIPAKTQLVNEYFDVPELVLDKEQKIMRLPNEWILSYPETLRRKDKIYLYAVNGTEDVKNEKLYIYNTIVAYVKDNANREVESLDTNRLVGSSTISVIELIITDKEFKILENYANNGYKFALMYQ